MLRHSVKLMVAACETVSSVAADSAEKLPVPFLRWSHMPRRLRRCH
ncbi:MAG: hypothetical protein ACLR56_01760 [Oscillospiraceae bacterium]